jgi:hypothetical protein
MLKTLACGKKTLAEPWFQFLAICVDPSRALCPDAKGLGNSLPPIIRTSGMGHFQAAAPPSTPLAAHRRVDMITLIMVVAWLAVPLLGVSEFVFSGSDRRALRPRFHPYRPPLTGDARRDARRLHHRGSGRYRHRKN